MGLFSGGLTFGSFFGYQIVGLIIGWANFQVGLLSGVYGIQLVLMIFRYEGGNHLLIHVHRPQIG